MHPSRSPQFHVDTSPSSHRQNPFSSPGVAGTTASRFFQSMRKSFTPLTSPRKKNIGNQVRRSIINVRAPVLTPFSDQRAAMYSTPEEIRACDPSRVARSRYLNSSVNRPTIEQIAMGLHVSRTPHLRPTSSPPQRHSFPSSTSHRSLNHSLQAAHASPYDHHDTSTSSSQYRTRHSLPPPPSRSSMKKTSVNDSTLVPPQQQYLSSASPSTSTVTSGGPATPESSRPLSSLRLRMSKFIPVYRPSSSLFSLGRVNSLRSSASDSTRPMTPRKAVRFSSSVLGIDEQSP